MGTPGRAGTAQEHREGAGKGHAAAGAEARPGVPTQAQAGRGPRAAEAGQAVALRAWGQTEGDRTNLADGAWAGALLSDNSLSTGEKPNVPNVTLRPRHEPLPRPFPSLRIPAPRPGSPVPAGRRDPAAGRLPTPRCAWSPPFHTCLGYTISSFSRAETIFWPRVTSPGKAKGLLQSRCSERRPKASTTWAAAEIASDRGGEEG